MRKILVLAALLSVASLSTATAQNAPTYQPPSGIITTPSSTGAVPATGSVTPNAPTPTTPSAVDAATNKPAATPATQTAPTGTASIPDQKVQKVVTQIIDETSVAGDGSAPPSIAARLPGLKTQPKLADIGDKLDYVQIVGTSSATTMSNGKRVGIQWTTVTRTDTGQTVTVQSPLASTVRLKGDVLPAKTKVTARGDADELYTAIRSLFDNQPTLQTANASNGSAKKSDAAPSATSPASTSGDVQAKPLANTSTKSSDSNSTQSLPVYDTTTNGCAIRVDLGQMQAIQQEATTTTVDGKTTQGACEDGGTRYTIVKTGLGCDDVVGDKQAQGQTKLYYVGSDGKPVTVQECQLDPDLIYPFVDEADTCLPFIDFNGGKVLDQVETVYRNNKNTRIVVAGCHPTGDGYAIQKTTDGCSLRDDFSKQQTIQQERLFYTKGGVQSFISSCQDSTTIYVQRQEACPNIVDQTAMKVFKATRIYIDGPSGKSYRSECAPADGGTDLQATTAGCESVHYDYPSADQSRGASRLYYMDAGAPVYLTQCQENTTVYKWTFVRTAWQNDDTALTSTELLAAHITLPAGDTEVSPAKVRPESAIQPYVSQGTQDVANGQAKTYQGCNAYTPTTRSQVYQRADSTTYTIAIGPGDAQGPVDECTRTVESQDIFHHACLSSTSDCGSPISQFVSFASTNGFTVSYNAHICTDGAIPPNNSSGTNWNAHQTRTTTKLPAGAGGTTTTGPWVTTGYNLNSTFVVYFEDNRACNGK
jgi:hypothetical protein